MRRKCQHRYVYASVIPTVGNGLLMFSDTVLVGRVVAGIGAGILAVVVPMYVGHNLHLSTSWAGHACLRFVSQVSR